MNKRTLENYKHLMNSLESLGFDYAERESLVKIERTLHRWHELECGDGNNFCSFAIEREEFTGKPFMVRHFNSGRVSKIPVADREKGALKRLAAIMEKHPELKAYQQGDPRGCALYIIRPGDVPEGESVNAYYSRGIAICF